MAQESFVTFLHMQVFEIDEMIRQWRHLREAGSEKAEEALARLNARREDLLRRIEEIEGPPRTVG